MRPENPVGVFEGHRCAVMSCSGCSRLAKATVTPFITEEINISMLGGQHIGDVNKAERFGAFCLSHMRAAHLPP